MNFFFSPLVKFFQFGFELQFYLLLFNVLWICVSSSFSSIKFNFGKRFNRSSSFLEAVLSGSSSAVCLWSTCERYIEICWPSFSEIFLRFAKFLVVLPAWDITFTLSHSHGRHICPWWSNLDLFSLIEGISCLFFVAVMLLDEFQFLVHLLNHQMIQNMYHTFAVDYRQVCFGFQQTDIGWQNYY